jgi:hypothetical protein
MASLLTPSFSNLLINDVQQNFSSQSNTYITIGRAIGTGVGPLNVEPIVWTTNERNAFFRNMVGVKKVNNADLQPVVPRVDWSANTVYDNYEDHIPILSYEDYISLGTVNANADVVLTGTANIFASNVVVGNGTSFNTFIFPGDKIVVNSATKTVVSVTNADHLIVNSNFANTNTNSTVVLKANGTVVVGNSANFIGNVESGNVVIIGNDSKELVAVRSNKVISLNSNLSLSFSNTTISRKDNTYPYTANTFYVRNSRDQVFKCLFNNARANSTIEPTISIDGQLPENPFILTADGYKWKYLYTIPAGLKQKFFTNKWMPVSNDAVVVESATSGRIDIIKVLWGGSGYLNAGNSNAAPILEITGADGLGANIVATVSSGIITAVTILNGGNNYTTGVVTFKPAAEQLGFVTIGGTVNVSSATVSANISNVSMQSFTGNIFVNDIVTVNSESRNVISVVSGTQLTVNSAFTYPANSQIMTVTRSNAVFDISFSPNGGHGADPQEELGTHSLMVSVELDDTENETIPMSDSTNTFDFNQVGIVVDPLVANGAFTANQSNYRVTTRLEVSDPGLTNFSDDETVYVGTSLSSATAVANVAHWDPGDNYLYINNISGTFESKQIVKGVTSGASVPILSISNSQIKLFSGELIYMENRSNIIRKDNQIDQVKIVLSF